MDTRLSTNLEKTLEKAERFAITALFSALLFSALSLPKATVSGSVIWTLLGLPVKLDPRLALLILYALYVFSCFLADNMLLHARDLALRVKDPAEVGNILTYPTLLTASPFGHFAVTWLPGVLVCFGVVMCYYNGGFPGTPLLVWWLLGMFGGLLGIGVSLSFRFKGLLSIVPGLKEQLWGARRSQQKLS